MAKSASVFRLSNNGKTTAACGGALSLTVQVTCLRLSEGWQSLSTFLSLHSSHVNQQTRKQTAFMTIKLISRN